MSTDKDLECLIEAITLTDARPLPNAIELAKGWLDGFPVHQSWPMKIHVMVREARTRKDQAT